MKQALMVVFLGGSLLLGMQSWGDGARRPSAHRLLNRCMSQEMTRSRSLSYNEASALCKARLTSAGVEAAPSVASAFPPRTVRTGGGS